MIDYLISEENRKYRDEVTSKIMSLIIQHEYYKEILSEKWLGRDLEQDALDNEAEEEKYYE